MLLHPDSTLLCVDNWDTRNYAEETGSYPETMTEVLRSGVALERWRRNVGLAPHGEKVVGLKSTDSVTALHALLKRRGPESFDLVYVDGGHSAAEVFADAVLALKLLKVGGVLIFDDYGDGTSPTGRGIQAFVTAFQVTMTLVRQNYRIFLVKDR